MKYVRLSLFVAALVLAVGFGTYDRATFLLALLIWFSLPNR